MEGRVGPGTTTVSKQFAQDRFVTDIAVDGISNRHALLGKSAYSDSPQLLPGAGEPSVEK